MAGTFDFCPNGTVPEIIPPENAAGVSLNGWNFSSKPTEPYQKRFRVTLHGLRWYLQVNGLFDETTNPSENARKLEKFYESNGTWDSFAWTHPHLGALVVRFASPLQLPAGISNSRGLLPPVELNFVHHNPGY